MSKVQEKPAAPAAQAAPSKTVTQWEFWSEFGGNLINVPGHNQQAQFQPFVPGRADMGKVIGMEDGKPLKPISQIGENQLYRGYLITRDPKIGAYLEMRAPLRHESIPEPDLGVDDPEPFSHRVYLAKKVQVDLVAEKRRRQEIKEAKALVEKAKFAEEAGE